MRPERLPVDHQGDLDDVRVGRAPVLLDGQLDERVAPVVEDPFETGELALRVASDVVGHVDVLALDDRPHWSPPRGEEPLARGSSECPRGRRDGRAAVRPVYSGVGSSLRSVAGQRSRATVIADTPRAPPARSGSAQAVSVAPVVTTSSTRTIQRPS